MSHSAFLSSPPLHPHQSILACQCAHTAGVLCRYGVFSKMQRKGLGSLDQVYDVRALRIIVKSKEDCYAALREVEKLWPSVEGRQKVDTLTPNYSDYGLWQATVLDTNKM